jgi:hypothetical protein
MATPARVHVAFGGTTMVVFKISRAISVICLVAALVLAILARKGHAAEITFEDLAGPQISSVSIT